MAANNTNAVTEATIDRDSNNAQMNPISLRNQKFGKTSIADWFSKIPRYFPINKEFNSITVINRSSSLAKS